jgi:predicted membrane channel-forming protein YqfA (hemolysin III family)
MRHGLRLAIIASQIPFIAAALQESDWVWWLGAIGIAVYLAIGSLTVMMMINPPKPGDALKEKV